MLTLDCGLCYGAANPNQPCCNTCNEVIKAYQDKGWGYDIKDFKQCNENNGKGNIFHLLFHCFAFDN